MKKILAIATLLSFLFSVTLSFTVSATNLDQNNTVGDVPITTTIDTFYMVIIPGQASVIRNTESTNFGQVRLHENSQLLPNWRVRVMVNSDTAFVHSTNDTQQIPFAVVESGTSSQVTRVDLTAPNQARNLQINVTPSTWAAANSLLAGTYNANVRFTIAYEPIA